jgi:hypothetical protein
LHLTPPPRRHPLYQQENCDCIKPKTESTPQ